MSISRRSFLKQCALTAGAVGNFFSQSNDSIIIHETILKMIKEAKSRDTKNDDIRNDGSVDEVGK